MHILDVIREIEELDLLYLQEGRSKMNFVKIGKYSVNLNNVTEMHAVSGEARIIISFAGADDNYIVVRKADEPEAFSQLMTWMDERPALLSDEV